MRFPGKGVPVLGSLFAPDTPKLPPIPEPAVAPDPDDKAAKAEGRRRRAQLSQQSGRLSTFNTEPEGTVLG